MPDEDPPKTVRVKSEGDPDWKEGPVESGPAPMDWEDRPEDTPPDE